MDNWQRIEAGHYQRTDGITIKRVLPGWWTVFLPNGERAQCLVQGEFTPHMDASGPTLDVAKYFATNITPHSPACTG